MHYELFNAACIGDVAHLRELISNGAKAYGCNSASLRAAANGGHVECVRELIRSGADVNANCSIALRWASFNGHTDCVRELINAGADVHACNDHALSSALSNGHAECVRELLRSRTFTSKSIFLFINSFVHEDARKKSDMISLLLTHARLAGSDDDVE